MADTELHYVSYDPDAIWEEMMMRYIEAGGDILYPGDEKEMLLRGAQAVIVQTLASVDNALRMSTLRYAVDDFLDARGDERGCPRIEASNAEAPVTITTNATGRPDVLFKGTQFTADGVMFYELTEDFQLTGDEQTGHAVVRAVEPGAAGNGLRSGTQLHPAATNSAIQSVIVSGDASGGNDREEDEAYRERIRQYGLASVTTGPERQYEAQTMEVSAEILDAKALNLGPGKVGVYVIIARDDHADAILTAIKERLNAYDTRPLTDTVTVEKAEDVKYTLKAEYKCDESSAVKAALQAAANEYQAWQDNTIGRAFNPDRLMAALYQAGASRVTWGAESGFNDGEVKYTEITDKQRCKGTITLEEAGA